MKMLRIVSAAVVGNILEVYDMTVYGFFSQTISQVFFPKEDKLAGIASVFAVFLIGYLARPFGSIIFGQIGDKIGRKPALIWSVLLIAFSTFMLGLLPTYVTIGAWAPVLLVVVRLLQGLSSGGELTGSTIFVVEHAKPGKSGFYGSLGSMGEGLGMLVASFIAWIVNLIFVHEQIAAWAWRLPFLLALFGGGLGWFIRRSVPETSLFKEAKQLRMTHSILNSKRELYKKLRQGASILGLTLFGVALSYLIYIFMVTYLSSVLHYTMREALTINISSVLLLVILEPLMGRLADKIGRRFLMMAAIIGSVIWVFPYFFLLQQHNLAAAFVAQLVMTVFAAAYFSIATVAMISVVPVKSRFMAVSFFYAIGASIFGGGTPFIATLLIKWTHSYTSLAIYIFVCALISFFAVYKLRATKRLPTVDNW